MTYFEAKQGSQTGQDNDEDPEANQVSQDSPSKCEEAAAGMQTRHTQTRNMKKATECLVSNECSCGR